MISFIVPAYNEERLLGATLVFLFSALAIRAVGRNIVRGLLDRRPAVQPGPAVVAGRVRAGEIEGAEQARQVLAIDESPSTDSPQNPERCRAMRNSGERPAPFIICAARTS